MLAISGLITLFLPDDLRRIGREDLELLDVIADELRSKP